MHYLAATPQPRVHVRQPLPLPSPTLESVSSRVCIGHPLTLELFMELTFSLLFDKLAQSQVRPRSPLEVVEKSKKYTNSINKECFYILGAFF